MFHNNSYLFLIVIVIVALFFAYPKDENFIFNVSKESFDNFSETKHDLKQECPNILVKDGDRLELLNTRKPRVPGINPVYFDNLEDYAEYYKHQRANNINCPVLFYQSTYDTQNKKGWRLLATPFEPNAGLHSGPTMENSREVEMLLTDANTSGGKFNQNQFLAFDPEDQLVGIKTKSDKVEHREDPMSSDWGGHEYTHNALLSGKFKDRTRDANSRILAPNN